MTANTSK